MVHHNAHCPRCGYDQRGPVSTWTDSCPLQGTCSECGLRFNWAEVLMPDKFEPRWCVEFVPRLRAVPLASVKTFVRSFNPWSFWTRLQMSQRVRRRRLIIYCLLLLFPFIATYVTGQTILASHAYNMMQRQVAFWPQSMIRQIAVYQQTLLALQTAQQVKAMSDEEREAALRSLPATVSNPAQFRVEVETYRPLSEGQLTQQIQWYQQWITSLQAQATAAPVINHSRLAAILEMLAFPLSQTSSGSIKLADGSIQPYVGPIHLYNLIIATRGTGLSLLDDERVLRALAGVLAGLLLTFLFPVTFILLPASRRRAKVRWWHVVRIFVYSLFAIETLALALIGLGLIQVIVDSALAMWLVRQAPMLFWIVLPVWWAVAIKRYLKMPHAAAIACIMTFMLMLLMSPLLMHVFPRWIMQWILDV